MKQRKNRDAALGMLYSTARSRLSKSIIYSLAKRLRLLNCHRCGLEIDNEKDLSIEHKESWILSSTPKKLFFDIDNIAFSHLHCNCTAGGYSRGVIARGKDVCKNGHPFDAINTYFYGNGNRKCRACRAINTAARRNGRTA